MDTSPAEPTDDALRRRLDVLESENARLKQRVKAVFGTDNPAFDPHAFQKAIRRYMAWSWLPMVVAMPLMVLATSGKLTVPRIPVGPTVLIDPGGMYSGYPGIGMGLIAAGGLAVGIVAVGGFAIGVLAIGGGAIGVFAIGGGAVGIVALGGGAVGLIAMGGGAFGRYVLAGNGAGRFVFSLKRQDRPAVEFFTRYLPRFKNAITKPMPVVPLGPVEDST